jgi:hypothetical protein
LVWAGLAPATGRVSVGTARALSWTMSLLSAPAGLESGGVTLLPLDLAWPGMTGRRIASPTWKSSVNCCDRICHLIWSTMPTLGCWRARMPAGAWSWPPELAVTATDATPRVRPGGSPAPVISESMQAVAHAWSQRGPATRLSDVFVAATGATDVTDLLAGLMRGRYDLSADSAPLVFSVASEEDRVALELVRRAGRELGQMAIGVSRQIGITNLPFEVVLSGGFYNGSAQIQESMAETIQAVAPGAHLVRLTAPPVVGGVLLGMEQVGLQPSAVRGPLIESTSRLLRSTPSEAVMGPEAGPHLRAALHRLPGHA